MNKTITRLYRFLSLCALLCVAPASFSACVDNVVLVHGNTGSPADWSATVDGLKSKGYANHQIFTPAWGSGSCAACNNHSGSEETPVRNAINAAIANSCTGKIDVIGHSMGVTLAAQQIIKAGQAASVEAFVGIAGAYRGLMSCGIWPAAVVTSTCGRDGLSVSSPFLDWLYGKQIANRVYSIKSWVDQVVCATGSCLIYGVHSSQIAGERGTFSYSYGHFGLQQYTVSRQLNLL